MFFAAIAAFRVKCVASLPQREEPQGGTNMPLNRRLAQMGIRVSLSLGTLAFMVSSAFAATPQATNLGPEDQSKQISVTVWLNMHNKAALDTMVQQMYDK